MKTFLKSNKVGAVVIEGHVQGLSNTRSLGEAGIPVFVVDKNNCLARYSRYCKKFFYCPNYIDPLFIDFLVDLAQTEGLHGWALIPSNDHAVISISKNRAVLEKYFKIITPGIEIIENIYDKSKLLSVAQKANIPFPKTYYLHNSSVFPPNIHFPVLTKGRQGLSFYKATGRKVFFSKTVNELKDHLIEIEKSFPITETFTQEFIPFDESNKTISFTAFCIDGEIKANWIGVKVREHPIQFGTATFARSIDCEELIEPSKKLLQELNYTGVCEVEYLKSPLDGEYKLIEINARTWLWVDLAKACGVNFAVMIYNYLNQIPYEYPEKHKIGVNWVNYITDSVFSLHAILRRKLKLKQYFCAFKGKTVNAIFSWRDILPGYMFLFLSVYIALKRK
jgi:D-aspartate ligase